MWAVVFVVQLAALISLGIALLVSEAALERHSQRMTFQELRRRGLAMWLGRLLYVGLVCSTLYSWFALTFPFLTTK